MRARPAVERLEQRLVLSGPGSSGPLALLELEPNDTLDAAQELEGLNPEQGVEVAGRIGNTHTGAADVDWYRFHLDQATHVRLRLVGAEGRPSPILALFNQTSDPFDFSDPQTPTGSRMLECSMESTWLERDLAVGDYYLVVSGNGNRYFHPFLEGSGTAGQTGEYRLQVETETLSANLEDGPRVLATSPEEDETLTGSPLVLRVSLDSPLDPGTVSPGGNVRLFRQSSVSEGTEEEVALAGVVFAPGVLELQIQPLAPLAPGNYRVFLGGDASEGAYVLADPNGSPLGATLENPAGADFHFSFEIAGWEGVTDPQGLANDTPTGALDLGLLQPEQLIQVAGTIGDDPYYDPNNPDIVANPSADVDLYHFQIVGPGRYRVVAEVFAGRLGSAADPGVSVYRVVDGTLHLLDGNNNTRNPTQATTGAYPLFTDALVTQGLTEGEYYVAVSSNYNTPSLVEGTEPGSNGIFDPQLTHSGQAGFSTGPYVLNLRMQPDNLAPSVVSTNPDPNETMTQPPTHLVVEFSEAMNLRALFFNAYEQTAQETIAAVFIQSEDGTRYFPRLESYDDDTNQARFLMLDALGNGSYELHLSSTLGLTDLAGHPLSNTEGDVVIPFQVAGAVRGNGEPHQWTLSGPAAEEGYALDFGPLFPREFQGGITLSRESFAADQFHEQYRFEVLQRQTYALALVQPSEGCRIDITDEEGQPLSAGRSEDGWQLTADLLPGIYVVHVSRGAEEGNSAAYGLYFGLSTQSDNAPPLTMGPAPALRLRFSDVQTVGEQQRAPAGPSPVVVIPDEPQVVPVALENPVAPVLTRIFASNPGSPATEPRDLGLPTGVLRTLSNGPVGNAATAVLADAMPITVSILRDSGMVFSAGQGRFAQLVQATQSGNPLQVLDAVDGLLVEWVGFVSLAPQVLRSFGQQAVTTLVNWGQGIQHHARPSVVVLTQPADCAEVSVPESEAVAPGEEHGTEQPPRMHPGLVVLLGAMTLGLGLWVWCTRTRCHHERP